MGFRAWTKYSTKLCLVVEYCRSFFNLIRNTTEGSFAKLSATVDTSGLMPWVFGNCRNDATALCRFDTKGGWERNLVSVKLARFIVGNHRKRFRCKCWKPVQALVNSYQSCDLVSNKDSFCGFATILNHYYLSSLLDRSILVVASLPIVG